MMKAVGVDLTDCDMYCLTQQHLHLENAEPADCLFTCGMQPNIWPCLMEFVCYILRAGDKYRITGECFSDPDEGSDGVDY